MEIAIDQGPLVAHKIAALRTGALLTDPDAFGELHGKAAARTAQEWVDWLASLANGCDRQIFVWKRDDEYLAMCGAGIDREAPEQGFIWGVYVVPPWRGRGGAEALMNTAHAWLAGRGVRRIVAKVAAPNLVAVRFYRRLGYRIGPPDGVLLPESTVPVHTITRELAPPQH